MQVQQDSSGRTTDLSRYSVFRQAKITAMYPTSNSADVVFFDGTIAKQVPILGGLCSSVFGLSYTVQPEPTTDKPIPPAEIFPEGHPPDDISVPCTVDIYAVVSSLYGPRVSTGGYFIVGFMYPQFTEMKFPFGVEAGTIDPSFDKFLVYRHASDDQITIDKNGTFSFQLPSGARISMGNINAIDGSDIRTNAVDLTQKDVNAWYHFCANAGNTDAVHMEDTAGDYATFDGQGTITIEDKLGDKIVIGQDKITVSITTGDSIVIQQGRIVINSTNTIQQNSTTNDITNDTFNLSTNTNNQTAITVNVTAAGDVNITAGSNITLTAPNINLNGNVNLGSFV